ncbi:MAG TPA: protein kinase [Thermoanaerobaculia bacterium]|nr:protein kinase [Thermoanaerobaculia bacterium]
MIGSTISRYKVLERLGGGGSGIVYKARDTKLERFVALKFLSNYRSANEADQRRFLREARAASVLDHPNLCTIYEIDETEEGRLFIAMAFCEGETLKARIERGPLPAAQAVGLAAQIAAGLEAAHEKGIVHRDVKPANVIVMPGDRVKIVDFGIAQLADESRLTRAGTAVGTAAYMSPEQLRGDPIDARTDVWSLGVLLHEALSGRMPFPGESDQERIRGILSGQAEPLRSLRPGVPPDLERIVARALAKVPADRYQSMKEMREDLLAVQGLSSVSSRISAGLEPTLIAIPVLPTGTRAQGDTQSLTGRILGHYRILEPIGGGGMGVVYKAEDLRLARVVALKFLPPELTRDPEAKVRFLQEARAASALDHHNICTVHEVGETDEGRLYLSMPCYDGETLRRRIERGPLSIDEATDIAQQVAKGLSKAHRGGIVHRDIKPANLVITSDGVVKILDFGLAKLAGAAAITRTGSSVGTPAYMSPEQARGEDVDHRTDLWSLGVVLYEMVTGKRPFRGEHEQAVLYSILNEKPKPLTEARVDAPAELEKIVGGLLAKNPADRYPAVDGALADLKTLRNEPMTATVRTDSLLLPAGRGNRPWVWAAVAAAAVVAGVGGFLLSRAGGGRAGADPLRANYSRLTNQEGSETFPSLSPDGDELVYIKASSPGNLDLWHQRVGGSNPRNLTADSAFDESQPAFSPDGQQIAFRSEREGGGLFVMGATGESVRRLTDAGYNPAWSPDGAKIAFATEGVENPLERRTESQLWIFSLATGEKRLLVKSDAVQPSWSPHGHRIAYWGLPPDSSERILWTVPAQGGEPVQVTDGAHLDWNPVWSPDGRHLYFVSDRSGSMNAWQVPIDEKSGKVLGDPEPVTSSSQSLGLLSLSKDGKLVYATNESRSNLVRLPFDPVRGAVSGEPQPVTQGAQAVRSAVASPDGQWIVFDTTSPQEDLFAIRPDGKGLRQLTNDAARDRIPRWSPDGSRILFYSDRGGEYGAWTIRPDGSGRQAIPHGSPGSLYSPLWSPDSRWLAGSLGNGGAALIDLTLPVERRLKLLPLPGRGQVFSPTSWSADGERLAGTVDPAEQTERSEGLGIALYSLAFGTYEKVTESGETPRWLSHGRGLVYLDAGRIFLLDLATRQPRPLLAPSTSSVFTSVNVSPDDRTLYAVRASDQGDVWLRTIADAPER